MAAGDSNVTRLVVGGYDHLTPESQVLSGDGAVSIKNGVVTITKGTAAAVTIANPTATTDDFKRLSIVSTTAAAHTVTLTGGFGNGGTSYDVATFAAAIGAGLHLIAFGGYWYVTGNQGITLA